MRLLLAILFSCLTASGATYYVSTNGNDTTGDGLAWGTAWRTLTKAETASGDWDTINVGSGAYDEEVYITPAIGQTWITASNAQTRAFRIANASNTLSGFRIIAAQDIDVAWVSYVRIEPTAHWTTVTNCWIGEAPQVKNSAFTFSDVTDTITSGDVDFVAAGFKTNAEIYWAGVSLTNEYYANMGKSGTIVGVENYTLYIEDGDISETETNSSAWSFIYPGTDYNGMRGINWVASGGTGATNCTVINNVFTNMPSVGMWNLNGHNHTIQGNEVVRQIGGKLVSIHGSGHTIISNHVHDCILPIYYSAWEFNNEIYHPPGVGLYDFVGGFLHTDAWSQNGNSNNVIVWNWFESIEQPVFNFGDFDYSTQYVGWQVVSNVFVGMMNAGSGSLNDMSISQNTFFKCGFNEDVRYTMTLGSDGTTNLYVTNNLFLSCGDHANLGSEGGFTLANCYGTLETNGNVIVGPEVNGNLIAVRDPWNPKGADGLPFTADDGLCPLPGSTLSGIGALGDAVAPIAHFRNITNPGWHENTGSNYNTAWQLAAPYDRATLMRPYTNPPTLGRIPWLETWSATNSVSGTWSDTNWIGVLDYSWDFGDGSRAVWTRWPDVSHTWAQTGLVSMTLWVTNSSSEASSTTRKYNIGPVDAFSNDIFHVASGGSDTNSGTRQAPFATLTNAMNSAGPGDYIVYDGLTETNWLDMSDAGAEDGTAANPITLVSIGGNCNGVYQEYEWWTWEGMEFRGTNIGSGLYAAFTALKQHGTTVRNCWFHDGDTNINAISLLASGGAGATNATFRNNRFERMDGGNNGATFKVTGWTNVVIDSNITSSNTSQGDFLQLNASDVTVSRNYCFGMYGDNHTDFFQIPAAATVPTRNITVERNWVQNALNDTNCQVGQIASDVQGSTTHTNVVFRNNVFIGLAQLNDSIDGLHCYNNLFYDCANLTSLLTTGGGANGSSYNTAYTNNIFLLCGADPSSVSAGWYYNAASGDPATNTTVFADYNYVGGTSYAAKQTGTDDQYHWAVTGTEANGINGGDPLFVNEGAYDFRLQTNSPLAGTGYDLSAVFTTDFFGRTRSSWDVGPFQTLNESGGGEPPPDPPPAAGAATISGVFSVGTIQ